ncbi:hypothetical protein MF672_019945 [Actinomadura sp. ATCC 31491]|uniref:Uncharacterized protein n=1 Tax=Actinomadura luzonensis TaxID=2805427 RepID=A0ABT0FUQ8_9ACTN|nr:hypothetical protein [Actinomadura luzonensis]MCK2216052.1 hypothetical protein [Actinomadura luzonensis]
MAGPDHRTPLLRRLAESESPRRYWHTADDTGRVWLFESVEGDGEHWAIRQVEVGADRAARRYWWAHPQDQDGFLTDQPLEIWDLAEINGAAFESVWEAAG